MIHSVSSDKPSFKHVTFKPGFNVVLAERTKESTKRDSRNGLGKSTLVEIIHFCLGGNKGETLSKPQLNDWSFTVELDIREKRYSVTRNTAEQNKVTIQGECSSWPLKPEISKSTGHQVMKVRDWNRVLGVLMFGLQLSYPDLEYVPTFRSLISYFVRRNGARGGFLNPFQNHKSQKEWDKQISNALLLGLNWEYASKWQILKDRLNVIGQIKHEAQSGMLATLMGTIGEIEARLIRLEAQSKQEEKELSAFRVHPQYRQIENEANELTAKIHELVNLNITDKRLIDLYEASLEEEAEAKPDDVTKMYEEAGVTIPQAVTKKIEEVLLFHRQIVANRREFLSLEIERLKKSVANKDADIRCLTESRAKLMEALRQHGALEEFAMLQTRHQKTVAEVEELAIRLDNLKRFEQGRSAAVVDEALLQQEASGDLSERKAQREQAILLFNANSKALYQAPGNLSIDVSKTGYKFNVTIERSGSHGIGNMKIFCYDLTLAQLWANHPSCAIFLAHDSILFADVDERQKALALELAAKEAEVRHFQYICTYNSDQIPRNDFTVGFDFDKHVSLALTDRTDDGGLLGIRF